MFLEIWHLIFAIIVLVCGFLAWRVYSHWEKTNKVKKVSLGILISALFMGAFVISPAVKFNQPHLSNENMRNEFTRSVDRDSINIHLHERKPRYGAPDNEDEIEELLNRNQ